MVLIINKINKPAKQSLYLNTNSSVKKVSSNTDIGLEIRSNKNLKKLVL